MLILNPHVFSVLLAVDEVSTPETIKGALISLISVLVLKVGDRWLKNREKEKGALEKVREDFKKEMAEEKKEFSSMSRERDDWHSKYFEVRDENSALKIQVAQLKFELEKCRSQSGPRERTPGFLGDI